jgi:hypothetical protein
MDVLPAPGETSGEGKMDALTPSGDLVGQPPEASPPDDFVEEFAGLKRLLSADGPGWAVAPSGRGKGNVLLVRDETVQPPSHLVHLKRYLVPELGERMDARDGPGGGAE